ncbi:MAG: RNA methyltransferase [Negativicoccus succinicivorans]|nr:RNA methyltransferase [Negativicoccus succinicivorans]
MKKEISSLQNPHWKRVCALSQRKYREQHGSFLVEGVRAVEVILQSAGLQYEIWATEAGLQASGLTIAEKVPLFIVPSKMFKALAQTEASQEIVAVVKTASLPKETDIQSGPIAVLCGVQDPGNAGTIVRLAAAAECAAVWTTKGTVDLFNDKAVRSSMGTILQIPVVQQIIPKDLYDAARKRQMPLWATTLGESVSYEMMPSQRNVFWLFGNEGKGIPEEILQQADARFHIPISPTVESLNVAMAAAIILFHHRLVREGTGYDGTSRELAKSMEK